jgi:hypothetical protein
MNEASPYRDGTATQGRTTAAMNRWTLRFPDRELERAVLDDYFRTVRIPIRVAYLLGITIWILWGLVVRWFLVDERTFDVVVRYAVLIPLLVAGLAMTYLPGLQRFFQVEIAVLVVLTGAVWIAYTVSLTEMPFDYGYVGVILIMTFSYSLVRMRFLWAVACSAILVALYVRSRSATASILIGSRWPCTTSRPSWLWERLPRTPWSTRVACCSCAKGSWIESARDQTRCSATSCPRRSSTGSRRGARLRRTRASQTRSTR